MKSRGLLKFRMAVITSLGAACILGAFSSHFVRPSQTPQAAMLTNTFIALFGAACFVQAYILKKELNARSEN